MGLSWWSARWGSGLFGVIRARGFALRTLAEQQSPWARTPDNVSSEETIAAKRACTHGRDISYAPSHLH